MSWRSGVPMPQRIRRFACLQDCLLTLTCHLALFHNCKKYLKDVDVVLFVDTWSTSVCRYDPITTTTIQETHLTRDIEYGHPG